MTSEDLKAANIYFTSNSEDLKKADFIIVAVPTPIDKNNKPDLTPLLKASETVGKVLTPIPSLYMNQLYIQAQQKKIVFQY